METGGAAGEVVDLEELIGRAEVVPGHDEKSVAPPTRPESEPPIPVMESVFPFTSAIVMQSDEVMAEVEDSNALWSDMITKR